MGLRLPAAALIEPSLKWPRRPCADRLLPSILISRVIMAIEGCDHGLRTASATTASGMTRTETDETG